MIDEIRICLICLRDDKELREIDTRLSEFHDVLCDFTVTILGPLYCSECEHLLRQAYNFHRKCMKATEILNKWKKEKHCAKVPIGLIHTLLPSSFVSKIGPWLPSSGNVLFTHCTEIQPETAPILHQDTAPVLQPETAPILHQDTAPILQPETAPILQPETASILQQETSRLQPDTVQKYNNNIIKVLETNLNGPLGTKVAPINLYTPAVPPTNLNPSAGMIKVVETNLNMSIGMTNVVTTNLYVPAVMTKVTPTNLNMFDGMTEIIPENLNMSTGMTKLMSKNLNTSPGMTKLMSENFNTSSGITKLKPSNKNPTTGVTNIKSSNINLHAGVAKELKPSTDVATFQPIVVAPRLVLSDLGSKLKVNQKTLDLLNQIIRKNNKSSDSKNELEDVFNDLKNNKEIDDKSSTIMEKTLDSDDDSGHSLKYKDGYVSYDYLDDEILYESDEYNVTSKIKNDINEDSDCTDCDIKNNTHDDVDDIESRIKNHKNKYGKRIKNDKRYDSDFENSVIKSNKNDDSDSEKSTVNNDTVKSLDYQNNRIKNYDSDLENGKIKNDTVKGFDYTENCAIKNDKRDDIDLDNSENDTVKGLYYIKSGMKNDNSDSINSESEYDKNNKPDNQYESDRDSDCVYLEINEDSDWDISEVTNETCDTSKKSKEPERNRKRPSIEQSYFDLTEEDSNEEVTERVKNEEINKSTVSIDRQRITDDLATKFEASGALTTEDGRILDKKYILSCLDEKVTQSTWQRLNLSVPPDKPLSQKSIDVLYLLEKRYKEDDGIENCEVTYFNTEEKMRAAFERRKSYERQTFQCAICSRPFKHKHWLKIHLQYHNEDSKAFVCSICNWRHKKRKTFSKHCRSHEALYKCTLCLMTTCHRGTMMIHSDKHLGVTYQCELCNVNYNAKSCLTKHMAKKHPKSYICICCGDAYRTQERLDAHKLKHEGLTETSYNVKCDKCQLSFLNEKAFRKHRNISHKPRCHMTEQEKAPFWKISKNCNDHTVYKEMGFGEEQDIRRKSRPKEKTCRQSKLKLRESRNKHLGNRPYSSVCPKRVKSDHNQAAKFQNGHHQTDSQIVCKICGKLFKSKAKLFTHGTIHDRRYKCKICSKKFKHPQKLREHVNAVHNRIRRIKEVTEAMLSRAVEGNGVIKGAEATSDAKGVSEGAETISDGKGVTQSNEAISDGMLIKGVETNIYAKELIQATEVIGDVNGVEATSDADVVIQWVEATSDGKEVIDNVEATSDAIGVIVGVEASCYTKGMVRGVVATRNAKGAIVGAQATSRAKGLKRVQADANIDTQGVIRARADTKVNRKRVKKLWADASIDRKAAIVQRVIAARARMAINANTEISEPTGVNFDATEVERVQTDANFDVKGVERVQTDANFDAKGVKRAHDETTVYERGVKWARTSATVNAKAVIDGVEGSIEAIKDTWSNDNPIVNVSRSDTYNRLRLKRCVKGLIEDRSKYKRRSSVRRHV